MTGQDGGGGSHHCPLSPSDWVVRVPSVSIADASIFHPMHAIYISKTNIIKSQAKSSFSRNNLSKWKRTIRPLNKTWGELTHLSIIMIIQVKNSTGVARITKKRDTKLYHGLHRKCNRPSGLIVGVQIVRK